MISIDLKEMTWREQLKPGKVYFTTYSAFCTFILKLLDEKNDKIIIIIPSVKESVLAELFLSISSILKNMLILKEVISVYRLEAQTFLEWWWSNKDIL